MRSFIYRSSNYLNFQQSRLQASCLTIAKLTIPSLILATCLFPVGTSFTIAQDSNAQDSKNPPTEKNPSTKNSSETPSISANNSTSANSPPVKPSLPKWRRYTEGPLRGTDFLKPALKPQNAIGFQFLARTETEIYFTYQYRGENLKDDVKLTATEVDVFTIIRQDLSWNSRPTDQRLMDHEQGHFDITEIYTRQAQPIVAELLKQKKIIGRGKDVQLAEKALFLSIETTILPLVQEMRAAHVEYDKVTVHGTNRVAQAAERKKQQQQLTKAPSTESSTKKESQAKKGE